MEDFLRVFKEAKTYGDMNAAIMELTSEEVGELYEALKLVNKCHGVITLRGDALMKELKYFAGE